MTAPISGLRRPGYLQNLPYVSPGNVLTTGPNANGPYSYMRPSSTNALYASTHNPFINFTGTPGALSQMVPDNQLGADLLTGQLPSYSLVVPDQSHDMHATGGCSDTNGLLEAGDRYVDDTVKRSVLERSYPRRPGGWANNAIVVT